MICWGEPSNCLRFGRNCDGHPIFCRCGRHMCLEDYPLEDRILVKEVELNKAQNSINQKSSQYLKQLDHIMKIKSISRERQYQSQNKQIIDRLAQHLNQLHFDVEVVEIKPTDEEHEQLQYVLLANYFSSPAKNVVLIYGYVDVLAIDEFEKWQHEPFQLTQDMGMLYGKGVATSKGPIMTWIQAVDAWIKENGDLPINMRFVIESSHFQDSRGLRSLIYDRKKSFETVDLIIHCTNFWVAENMPMIITSYSGYIYFELEVRAKDSKTRPDTMSELCLLMNSLMDVQKGILVEGLHRHVLPPTQNDWNIMCKAESGIMEYKESLGLERLPHELSRADFLKHRWCMCSLSIHNVKAYPHESLSTFHKPTHCVTKFSVKLVPEQSMEYVIHVVRTHLNEAYRRLKCAHRVHLRVLDQLAPLNESHQNLFRQSIKNAFSRAYNCEAVIPDNISVSLPMLNELRKYCRSGAYSVAVPFSSIHSGPNRPDECISEEKYLKNLKLCLAIMYEVALHPTKCKCHLFKDYCFEQAQPTNRDPRRYPRITYAVHELDENKHFKNMNKQYKMKMESTSKISLGHQEHRKLD